jgi:CO/xanthine dehydrogenase FAD-binding subunit
MSFTIATTVDEALVALAAGARPVAGGSDLVVGARHGKAPLPVSIVAIDRLAELATIDVDATGIRIGAGVNHARLMSDDMIAARYSALADASALVGSPSTRNVGTLGGNVMNGSPAMDTGAPLVVFGAMAQLRSTTATRMVSMSDLWIGPGRTSATSDELCVALHIAALPEHSGSAYVRLEYRRAMEIAVVGAGALVTLNSDGTVAACRVALTAVAPTIIEVTDVATTLIGRPFDAAAGALVAELAGDQASPISDLRATDRYRRHCVGVMARRAVDAAARRASGEVIAIPVNRALGIGAA